jgi:lysozyme family protein
MSRSTEVIPLILEHEGGYVNHPNDPGGPTNKGITLANFRAFIKADGTIEDLKALTTEQATIVYKRQYWDKVVADLMPPGIDYVVADFAVNSGPHRAAIYLQKVVGEKQDGKIGPQTLAAVGSIPASVIINRLCDERLAFMRRIRGGSLWQTFGRGWQKRVDRVRAGALEMVE